MTTDARFREGRQGSEVSLWQAFSSVQMVPALTLPKQAHACRVVGELRKDQRLEEAEKLCSNEYGKSPAGLELGGLACWVVKQL